MSGEESPGRDPGALSEEQAERLLSGMNEVIRAGEEARALRAEVVRALVGMGWTQDTIARISGMSQPAVSKQVARQREGDPAPPIPLSLAQYDIPWLEGRLWGLAEEMAETLDGTARCTRAVRALARGRKRFTPQHVDELRRLVEEDLRLRRTELPAAHRAAYDEISRGLDLPADVTATGAAPVRRALARRIQRDRLASGT
ncbi:sigma-70 family RNA polymerase sigma factor [Streptomyces fructofermentans]|uniref:sigma-70 family RNA polymerase sigma factor n=1 Tax=Streptomyces fructofermentans TaxID=152141 RepID=UPI0033DD3279